MIPYSEGNLGLRVLRGLDEQCINILRTFVDARLERAHICSSFLRPQYSAFSRCIAGEIVDTVDSWKTNSTCSRWSLYSNFRMCSACGEGKGIETHIGRSFTCGCNFDPSGSFSYKHLLIYAKSLPRASRNNKYCCECSLTSPYSFCERRVCSLFLTESAGSST